MKITRENSRTPEIREAAARVLDSIQELMLVLPRAPKSAVIEAIARDGACTEILVNAEREGF
jgi:hypothetical protein